MPEYIDRDAVLQTLKLDCIGEMQEDAFIKNVLVAVRDKIYRLPVADVAQVVHGRWKKCKNYLALSIARSARTCIWTQSGLLMASGATDQTGVEDGWKCK